MNKVAFMFPGQGAQAVSMGHDLYENSEKARYVFDSACKILNKDIKKLCFEGPEEDLKQTINTQSCLLTVSIAAYEAFREKINLTPNYTLGHSLGEYSAMYVSGVMDLENVLLAIQKRSEVMQEACDSSKGGAMAAVLGSSEDVINECLALASNKGQVSVANYNEPNQIVITGEVDAVLFASQLIKEHGARKVVPLAVSGGFHSKLMQSATDKFVDFVKELKINDAKIPVVTNIDAQYTISAHDFMKKMPDQISNSVYWTQSVKKLLSDGVDTFIEFGSGKVLTGLNKKICPIEVKTYNVSDMKTLQIVADELNLAKV